MEENDEQRRALIHEYYQIYRALQKRHSLREHSHFDIYGNNLIEIWEYEGERSGSMRAKGKGAVSVGQKKKQKQRATSGQ